jgi:hypothetical protein
MGLPPSAHGVTGADSLPGALGATGKPSVDAADPATPQARRFRLDPGADELASPSLDTRRSRATTAAQAYEATTKAAEATARPASLFATLDLPALDAARPAHGLGAVPDPGPPIHPGAEGIVRQQLELLATQQFRWTGEAWPGIPMQWDIARERDSRGGRQDRDDGHASPDNAMNWSSRLVLQLPRLGEVEALLTLTPNGLEARVVTPQADSVTRLAEARSILQGHLEAKGIAVLRLTVDSANPDAAT